MNSDIFIIETINKIDEVDEVEEKKTLTVIKLNQEITKTEIVTSLIDIGKNPLELDVGEICKLNRFFNDSVLQDSKDLADIVFVKIADKFFRNYFGIDLFTNESDFFLTSTAEKNYLRKYLGNPPNGKTSNSSNYHQTEEEAEFLKKVDLTSKLWGIGKVSVKKIDGDCFLLLCGGEKRLAILKFSVLFTHLMLNYPYTERSCLYIGGSYD